MAAEPPAKLDFKSRRLVNQIVEHVKSQGIFDQFRRDCIEELEQKVGWRANSVLKWLDWLDLKKHKFLRLGKAAGFKSFGWNVLEHKRLLNQMMMPYEIHICLLYLVFLSTSPQLIRSVTYQQLQRNILTFI